MESNPLDATTQRAPRQSERMAELERLFLGLLSNFENLAEGHSELARRFAAGELERAAEAVAP